MLSAETRRQSVEALVMEPEAARGRQTATPVEAASGPDSKLGRRDTVVRLLCPSGDNGVQLTQRFHFDGVFGYETPPQRLYLAMVRPLVSAALKGYNTSIMMFGKQRAATFELAEGVPEQGRADTRSGSLLSAAASHFLASQARMQKASDDESKEVSVVDSTGDAAHAAASGGSSRSSNGNGNGNGMATELCLSCYTLSGQALIDVFVPDSTVRAQITSDGHAQVVGLKNMPINSLHDLTAALLLVHRYRNTAAQKKDGHSEGTMFYLLQLTRLTRNAESEPISGAFLLSVIESPTGEDFEAAAARRASFLDGLKANDSTSSFALPGAVSDLDLSDEDLDDSDSDGDDGGGGGMRSPDGASPTKISRGKLRPTLAFLSIINQLGHSSSSVALYNSSVLTTILRGALGGNGQGLLFLDLGDDGKAAGDDMTPHLLQMLNVGAMARAIKNKATVSRKFLAQRALLMAYRRAMGVDEEVTDSSSGSSDDDDDDAEAEFGSDENLLRSYRAKHTPGDADDGDSSKSPKSVVVDRGRAASPSLGEKLNETWKPPEFGASGSKRDIAHLLARPKSAGRTRLQMRTDDADTDSDDSEATLHLPDREARKRGAVNNRHSSVTSDEGGGKDEDGPPPLEDRTNGDDGDVPFPAAAAGGGGEFEGGGGGG
eukprot:gene9827-15516_t